MKASIIIPTYHRTESLGRTIQSALELDFPALQYETIVVDNASSAGTGDLVKEIGARTQGRTLRYVREERLGLHFARHAGVRAARGEILLFTDDDASLDRQWLAAHARAFEEHPEMAAAGGPVRPVWETPPPRWVSEFGGGDKVYGVLSLMEPYDEFRLDPRGVFFGVNMAIRRIVLFEVGGFNPDSFGDIWLGDGESGLNWKLWKRGDLIGYVPDAIVHHYIPPGRMKVRFFLRRAANQGACNEYTWFHEKAPDRGALARRAGGIAWSIAQLGLLAPARLAIGRKRLAWLRISMDLAQAFSRLGYVLRLLRDEEFLRMVEKENWLESADAGPHSEEA